MNGINVAIKLQNNTEQVVKNLCSNTFSNNVNDLKIWLSMENERTKFPIPSGQINEAISSIAFPGKNIE